MTKLFVSYSRKDKADVVAPVIQLLKKEGYECWFDEESINYGTSFPFAISEAIQNTDIFLVFYSLHYEKSLWCKRELAAIILQSIKQQRQPEKLLLIVNVNEANVMPLLADLQHLAFRRGGDHVSLAKEIKDAITRAFNPAVGAHQTEGLVNDIFECEKRQAYGANLVESESSLRQPGRTLENEGLILIKPGGTFFEPCITYIFEEIRQHCRIKQLKLFDGKTVDTLQLFEKLYCKQTAYASGEIPLSREDYGKIREYYETEEFKSHFGVPYHDDLVKPALELCRRYKLDEDAVTAHWDSGRDPKLWHNGSWNGLNKIGYQKSVFPVQIEIGGEEGVVILLNGYIPGLRKLFTDPTARIVAIHAVTAKPWSYIRSYVVGGESDPAACQENSIRYKAYAGEISLDPNFRPAVGQQAVNGQRNVCHASATVLDGFRELIDWFRYSTSETIMGQLLPLVGVPADDVLKQDEELFAKLSRCTREQDYPAVLSGLHFEYVKERLQDRVGMDHWLAQLCAETGVGRTILARTHGLHSFLENAIRLEEGGEALYIGKILEMMSNVGQDERTNYIEIARRIAYLGEGRVSKDVLAEAFRIAAGDLLWLNRPPYSSKEQASSECPPRGCCSFPCLLRAKVIAELAEQAIACAERTKKNLILSAKAFGKIARSIPDMSMHDTADWAECVRSVPKVSHPVGDAIGLILCGGRSTRMSSTIPKAILPLRGKFLFDHARENIHKANLSADIYAAVGYRAELLKLALSNRTVFLDFPGLHGPGFRVAACLESLKSFKGLVILAYCDMPHITAGVINQLMKQVIDNDRAFGFAISWTNVLSGHVEFDQQGGACRIIQQRLHPGNVAEWGYKDVGIYVFHNTEEFRSLLGTIRNDNVRGEFMFADVIGELSQSGWKIVTVEENPANTQSINKTSELLLLTCHAQQDNLRVEQCVRALKDELNVKVPCPANRQQLLAEFERFTGPVFFFSKWDDVWEGLHDQLE